MMKKPLELYIHIPFCARKCAYCDFLSSAQPQEVQEAYIVRLTEEIKGSAQALSDYEVSTVFFGGGTPGILPGEALAGILKTCRETFPFREDTEITVETNPGTADADKLNCYQEAGVNRISFGLQSADDRELRLLGRIHTWEQFLESFALARSAGFTNINVDLMSALPGQTCAAWRETLKKVLALSPEHISAYSLIIEEGTPFYGRYHGHPELLPSEDEERQMYYDTRDILRVHGYERYEISNYARPGFACRHNLGYWERAEYKGFGLGAASLLGNVRTKNETELARYLGRQFAGSREILTGQDIREEYFFLGLRKTEGVDPGPYEEHYHALFDRLISQGLLVRENGRIRLTERGTDISNYVMAKFLE